MAEIEYFPENALFGKYELGKLLGRGAFAKVYHARNIATGQSVAIKVINKKKVAGNSLASNVKREVYIMSRLRHHHIVRLFEVLASKTKIYFVMEFVKGGELFAKVAKKKFSENLGRNYFQQLISAVGYCHSHGVFHRDLKPENLLVDEKGDMKVSDFGLSAVADQIRHDGLLHTLCGTPAYVAPEILLKKGYDGAKVDIWSCGVILFVMTAGFLPFNDPNLMVMYKKIYRGEFRFPKWMSSDLKRFLSRLLDTNHETRITIDGILHDPWFTKGGFDENKFREQQEENEGIFSMAGKEETEKSLHLNAFDLISFSPSLNLSGLLDDSYNGIEDSERFISDEPPERIVEKVEEIGKVENLRSKNRKDWSLELLGYNGNFLVGVEIYRLTESLVIAEVRRRGGDAKTYREVWKTKLRPEILKMTSRQREELVSRD